MSILAAARVIVVDDETLVVDGLCSLLAACPDLDVVARCLSVEQLALVLTAQDVDIVITDHGLPDGDVTDVLERIRTSQSRARVVVLTDTAVSRRIASSMDAGAAGYLLRTQGQHEVIAALRVIAAGGFVLAPGATDALVARSRSASDRGSLSPREREVLQSVANTGSTRKAADDLVLKTTTVRNHLQRAITKLGAHSTVEAVVVAIRDGIIDLPDRSGRRAS